MNKLLIVLIFCILIILPLFCFQTIRDNSIERKNWVNDGKTATTFVYYCQPFNIFSEDFHLYFIRAKRVFENGWYSDVFSKEKYLTPDFRNFFQVIYCLPFALSGGNIYIVSTLYLFYIFISFLILFNSIKYISKDFKIRFILTVFIIVLLGSKFYRVGTVLLSGPLTILLFIRLLKEFSEKTNINISTCLSIFAVNIILLFFDIWAAILAITFSILFLILIFTRTSKVKWFICFFSLALPIAAFIFSNNWIGENELDLGLRSGILNFETFKDNFIYFFKDSLDYPYYSVTLILVLIYVAFFASVFQTSIIIFISLLPYCIAFVFYITLGSELGQLQHFFHYQGAILFGLICFYLFSSGVDKNNIILFFYKNINVFFSLIFMIGILSSLFFRLTLSFYQNKNQSLRGISAFAVPEKIEFFLTEIKKGPQLQNSSIFTFSYELNYLLAFHTSAKLLLPSGFPLHSRKSNDEIITSLMSSAEQLNISKKEILSFISNNQDAYQLNWNQDRLESERSGFTYNLLHQGALMKNICDSLSKERKVIIVNEIDYIVFEPILDYILKQKNISLHFKHYSIIPFKEFSKELYLATSHNI